MRYKDYLITKTNVSIVQVQKKIYGKVKTGMPNPLVTYCQLEEIISSTEEFEATPYFSGPRKRELTRLREQKRDDEQKSLRYLVDLQESYHEENKSKVCSYIEVNKD